VSLSFYDGVIVGINNDYEQSAGMGLMATSTGFKLFRKFGQNPSNIPAVNDATRVLHYQRRRLSPEPTLFEIAPHQTLVTIVLAE
jgi:hypothetical protein